MGRQKEVWCCMKRSRNINQIMKLFNFSYDFHTFCYKNIFLLKFAVACLIQVNLSYLSYSQCFVVESFSINRTEKTNFNPIAKLSVVSYIYIYHLQLPNSTHLTTFSLHISQSFVFSHNSVHTNSHIIKFVV